MDELLERNWWVLALRGVVALVFAVLVMLWPAITLLVLVALFAAYAIVAGAVAAWGAVKNRDGAKYWWLLLLLGLVSIAGGVIAVFYPGLTALVLVLVMGANALVTGALDLAIAIRLRKVLQRKWLLVLAGLASVAFGILVLLFPGAGALALVWLISFHAAVTGVLFLALAFRLRAKTKGEGGEDKGAPVGAH